MTLPLYHLIIWGNDMADNVVPLFEKQDTAEDTIKKALESGFKEVLIIGFGDDDLIRYRSCFKDVRHEIAAIELVKHHIIALDLRG